MTGEQVVLERVVTEPNTGCWLWSLRIRWDGYGQLRYAGRSVLAHRWSWTMTRGEIPPGFNVLHRCDTRACVNPAHLFLGTHEDNMRDMVAKGRGRALRGSDNPTAKLTPAAVAELRRLHAAGATQKALSSLFGVQRSRVSLIVRGLAWEGAA